MTDVPDARPQTRAFLFADLRGYSAYVDRHGDRAAEALIGRYRALVRATIATFDGAEIRTEGDGFYVVFDSVGAAVKAALAIRDGAQIASDDGAPIPVGIGIHAGEARDGEHGIVSSAVNIAARVCAAARAGEVLVTETVRSLIRTSEELQFRPAGKHRLKGVREPVTLFRVDAGPLPDGTAASPLGVVVLAGAVVLGTALIAAIAARPGAGPALVEPTPSPRAVSTSSSPAASTTHDLSRFSDLGEFPNVQEATLLDRLPAAVASRCERADRDEIPEFSFDALGEGFQGRVPLETQTGLDCLTGPTRVFYWKASGSPAGTGNADELFFDVAHRLSITPGNCESESRKYEEWSAGAHSGMVMCYVSVDNRAVLEWTFSAANIYAIATRRDADTNGLHGWWRDTGRLLSR